MSFFSSFFLFLMSCLGVFLFWGYRFPTTDLYIGKDMGGLNFGVSILRNSQWTVDALSALWEDPQAQSYSFAEQKVSTYDVMLMFFSLLCFPFGSHLFTCFHIYLYPFTHHTLPLFTHFHSVPMTIPNHCSHPFLYSLTHFHLVPLTFSSLFPLPGASQALSNHIQKHPSHFFKVPMRTFNSYTIEVPGTVQRPDAFLWAPNDFLVHHPGCENVVHGRSCLREFK